jgi:RHS repeat-associated protein
VARSGYDALGHLVQTVDAAGNVTQFTYQHDLLQKIRDANGNETRYGYSGVRDLTNITYPDGAMETYDTASGILHARTDRRGNTIRYSYDGLGRIISALYDGLYNNFGGRVGQFYAYDGQKLIEMDDDQIAAVTVHNYTYDSSWRLLIDNLSAAERKTYTYIGTGSLVGSYTIQPPNGTNTPTQSVSFGYGPNGAVTSETWSWLPSGQFTFEYTPGGQYSRMTFPNGQQRRFAYDSQDRLTNINNTSPGGETIASFDYAYDYDWQTGTYSMKGQRTSATVTAPGAANIVSGLTRYSYDDRYQLIRTDYPSNTYEVWTYDAIGNRLSRRHPIYGYVLPYTYFTNAGGGNTQRLRNDSSYDFSYDASGNLTGASSQYSSNAYTWDYAGRLTSYGGKTYTYDVFGRTSVVSSGSTTRYISLGGNTVGERNTTAGVVTDYVFGPGIDEPLAKRAANGSISYFGVDGLGSVVVSTDPTGAVLSSTGYSPWGETSTPSPELFGYTAREAGGPSWYYRSRYYDAGHGRFVSEDSLEQHLKVAALEAYKYTTNNPVNYDDPFGYACHSRTIYGLRETLGSTQTWTKWMEGDGHNEMPHEGEGDPNQDAADSAAHAGGYLHGPEPSGAETSFGVVPWTPEKCIWTRFLNSTEHWRQKMSVEITCDCPPRRWISPAGSRTGTTRTMVRRQRTYTDGMGDFFGVTNIDCPAPPD